MSAHYYDESSWPRTGAARDSRRMRRRARKYPANPLCAAVVDAAKTCAVLLLLTGLSAPIYFSPWHGGVMVAISAACLYGYASADNRWPAFVSMIDRLIGLLALATSVPLLPVLASRSAKIHVDRCVGVGGRIVPVLRANTTSSGSAGERDYRLADSITHRIAVAANLTLGSATLVGRSDLDIHSYLEQGPFYLNDLGQNIGVFKHEQHRPPSTAYVASDFASLCGAGPHHDDDLILLLRVNVLGPSDSVQAVVVPYIVAVEHESRFRSEIARSRTWTDGDAIVGKYRHAAALLHAAWDAWSAAAPPPCGMFALDSLPFSR